MNIDRKYKDILPLKIEIDQFLNWIKENKIKKGESYDKFNDDEIKLKLEDLIKEYYDNYNIEDEYIKNYNKCRYTLNENKVNEVTDDELYEALLFINAFRFSSRRHSIKKEEFFKLNNLKNIQDTIKYLLYDNESYETKFENCICKDKKFKLKKFGENCVKELFGVMSDDENIPICNNRVLKAMEYLGFGNLQ